MRSWSTPTFGRHRMNIFDGCIVFISLIELVAVPPEFLASKSQRGPLTVLRVFRLFRMFKFARNWASLRVCGRHPPLPPPPPPNSCRPEAALWLP